MKKPHLFNKVLIANRGEIACRLIKTLRKMSIPSVAVYSEADTNALHVLQADEAYCIGKSPATESYLAGRKIIEAILISGAQAVHPGYGFLSENAEFAKMVTQEGINFIGPSANSIKMMGDKIEAKKIAINSGVSTVPGYIGSITDSRQAVEIAQDIGFPVMVKAAAGGGGRGMRIANTPSEMQVAYHSAQLEAANSFNDDRLFIEKLIKRPRHIEIQVLADKYGNIVCLGERECSIQRYHQKIIEETPSVFINEEIRRQMYEQVVLLCRQVNYHSAGTVEFIMDQDQNFYFLEMNTRLQVEHTVTEMVTKIDIVEEMIKIAAGEKLSFGQEDIKFYGSSMECRVCAEDPARNFLPSIGRITEYTEPAQSSEVRIDSGVYAGAEVSVFYDSMILKLCTHASDRENNIKKMQEALSCLVLRGIAHNISFLETIISHPRYKTGDINTNFIQEEYPDGFGNTTNLTPDKIEVFIATALDIFMQSQKRLVNCEGQVLDQSNNIGTRWIVNIDGQNFHTITKLVAEGYKIRYGTNRLYLQSNWQLGPSKLYSALVNGKRVNVKLVLSSYYYSLSYMGHTAMVRVISPRVAELETITQSKENIDFQHELLAPLTGTVKSIKVSVGDIVIKNQDLIVISAMKMDNIIISETKATVIKIHATENKQVSSGDVLMEFEPCK